MPYVQPRACKKPGCPGIARGLGVAYCPEHASLQAEADRKRKAHWETKHPGRHDGDPRNMLRWKRTRAAYLKGHPFCERCEIELAEEVHHRVALAAGGSPFAQSNLEALCSVCHALASAEERRAAGAGGGCRSEVQEVPQYNGKGISEHTHAEMGNRDLK